MYNDITEENKEKVLRQLMSRMTSLVSKDEILDIAYSVCLADNVPNSLYYFSEYTGVYSDSKYTLPATTATRITVDTLAILINKYMRDNSIKAINLGVSSNTISNNNIIDILNANHIDKRVELISSKTVSEFNSSLAIKYWKEILDKIAPNIATEELEVNIAILTSILMSVVGNPELDNGRLTKYIDIQPLVDIVSRFNLNLENRVPKNIRGVLKHTGTATVEDWYRAMYDILCNFLDKGFAKEKVYISTRLYRLVMDTKENKEVDAPFGIKVKNAKHRLGELKPKIHGLYVYLNVLFNTDRKCDLDGALMMTVVLLVTMSIEGTRFHNYRFELLKSDLHQIKPD